MSAVGCLEAIFFTMQLGLGAGFFCLLLAGFVWPATNVEYVTEAQVFHTLPVSVSLRLSLSPSLFLSFFLADFFCVYI